MRTPGMPSHNAPPNSADEGAGPAADPREERLTLPSRLSELALLSGWLEHLVSLYVIPEASRFAVNLCLEEVISNIITHGYRGDPGHSVLIRFVMPSPRELVFIVQDQAPPFNPLDVPEPPSPGALRDATLGGQGVRLVRRLADRIEYERLADGNRLTLGFHVPAPARPATNAG